MDFLKDMQNKLQELEEFAREAQEMQQQGRDPSQALFTLKKKKSGGRRQQQQQAYQKQQPKRQQRKQQQTRQQRPPQQQARSSRRPVDSPECPVEEWREEHPQRVAQAAESSSLLDNLAQHLGDAFLLQEVLGPPMCMRDED